VLPKGTPVAQCFPVPRAAPDLVFEALAPDRIARYVATTAAVLATPGVYRKRFRVRRRPSGGQ
jgi:hypothetical protein